MIGDKSNPNQSPLVVAVRDAAIVGGSAAVVQMLAFGYPPRPEALYLSGLMFLVTFFESLIISLGLKKPPQDVTTR